MAEMSKKNAVTIIEAMIQTMQEDSWEEGDVYAAREALSVLKSQEPREDLIKILNSIENPYKKNTEVASDWDSFMALLELEVKQAVKGKE